MKKFREDDPIYLDGAASMPIDPIVLESIIACLEKKNNFGNPSSMNIMGRRAMSRVDVARGQLSSLLNADADDLIWTSGATESNNIAIIGSARYRVNSGRHLVTMTTEHKAVSAPFDYLESEGFEITRLSPESNGLLDMSELKQAIRNDTQLVSVMHVNNETGITQNIAEIADICQENQILFHCDAAQSVGKIKLDLKHLPIDLLSISSHKIYGPQGIGALYLKNASRNKIIPLMFGGEQEKWLRPGTLPLHQIIGFGVASELAASRMDDDFKLMKHLSSYFLDKIKAIPNIILNGSNSVRYPGIINLRAPGVNGESLLLMLEPACVAQGSACNSKNNQPSLVLRELGLNDHEIQSSIRFSFTRNTTESEIDEVIKKYMKAVSYLRGISPDYH